MGDQADYERGAERLFEAVTKACAGQVDFDEQVRAALAGGLTFLSSEPDLAKLLVLQPYHGDRGLLESHRSWRERYADLLRRAARSSPEASTNPPFVEPTLIGGIRWQIVRPLLAGQSAQLPELAPALARYVLCYYLPPKRARHAVAASSA